MGAGRVILSEQKLNLVLDRLAHQLIEHHGDFRNSCLIGIQPRGTVLLERIIKRLKAIAPNNSITYGLLDITFHRDDFRTRHEPLKASITKMDFLVDNRRVILVDDVLYTGRTIQAAISALQHYGRAEKIELLVLIDRRFNRDLPIQSDYSGMAVDALDQAYVKVEWEGDRGGKVRIYSSKEDIKG
ncbi:MAG: bifunctional pyr operon transcriptional regulator/uracil phosphoribosyltransferase PyrR [Saprospiraceae bacterium]